MKYLFILLLATFILVCGNLAAAVELSEVTLGSLPKWVNLKGFEDPRFPIDVRLLSEKAGLTLREALEVQNHYYDLATGWKNKATPVENFQKALARVKGTGGKYESVWKQERIEKAKFIVVFALDDTLLNQYYSLWEKGEEYWDIALRDPKAPPKKKKSRAADFVKLTPHWKEIITRVRELDGAVVLFTAKVDWLSFKIFEKWMWDETTHISEIIDGFMTKHHLSLVPGHDWERGKAYPMKDLALIEPTLEKIILIDDNPLKTCQPSNVRVLQKYNPDIHLGDETPVEVKKMYDNLLKEVMVEIEESVAFMDAHPGITFRQSYKPYSHKGRVALTSLLAAGIARQRALELIRITPDMVKNEF